MHAIFICLPRRIHGIDVAGRRGIDKRRKRLPATGKGTAGCAEHAHGDFRDFPRGQKTSPIRSPSKFISSICIERYL